MSNTKAPMHHDFGEVYQFRISLDGIEPVIWRRIQVPSSYSFWDLHVAIQDAMGWLDYHLHLFRVPGPQTGETMEAGIPGMELFEDDEPTPPSWDFRISDFFSVSNARAQYEYDFGDSWEHEIVLEDILPRDEGVGYPRCVAGQRACPPEDVGGVPGYEDFLTSIADPEHEQHEESLEWAGGAFDPEAFDPAQVEFGDPSERWQKAFGSGESAADLGFTGSRGMAGLSPGLASPSYERFSPAEMHGLLYSPFDEKLSPLVLDTDLEDEAFDGATFVVDVRRYLQMLRERQPLKLTQAGNLPRRFVQDLWSSGALSEAARWGGYTPAREMDAPGLTVINLMTVQSGLVRKLKGKLLLTRKAEDLLVKKGVGALYEHLFRYYTSTYNWAYGDTYPESWILQGGFGYTLYLLQQYGAQEREESFYAERFRQAFPHVIAEFGDVTFWTPEEFFSHAYSSRVLRDFTAGFGLAELREEGHMLPDRKTFVTGTPLLNRVIRWKPVEAEV